ncbi:MAG TPA: lipopolysaccharide transport periplasmic protein LptA [Gammaproteobacteria bacterium]|nr:lipopolysaccharide transport periplasmic protein LptA [Gammaproteobacteria bacterium]HBF07224.1 lipopolysaccharide transport periplasmic protein LptA [Gammaproteobacteria bacterium]HCK91442.1 lipopolysaccharide transport periplasmic protein LptA [Gammaproteobacteria bacterium]|tara:strand:- start:1118 stop:1657 length:540 start_codon:yes stop_codon:yes gene_type:complete
MKKMKPFSLLILALGLSAAMPTLADNEDYDRALSIAADDAEIDEPKGWAAYTGNVELKQGALEIKCDKLEIFRENDGISKVVASGNPAYFSQKIPKEELKPNQADSLNAEAQTITYQLVTKSIELEGKAQITQGDTLFEGHTIEYQIESRKIIAKSNQAEQESGEENQRVKIVLPVREQ